MILEQLSGRHRLALCAACLLCLASQALLAQEEPAEQEEQIEELLEEETPATLELESSLTLELGERDGQDDDRLQRDTGFISTDLTLGLRQALGDTARVVAQLELTARYLSQSRLRESPEYNDTFYDLERLYVQQFLANRLFRWRLGRQNIDDLMNSAVDETLDGLRITLEKETLQLDLSFTRQNWIEASTEDRDDEIYNALAQFTYRPHGKTAWMPYLLFRDQRALNPGDATAENIWFGLQGVVRPSEQWRYWFSAASRDGDETDDDEQESLGGFAVNLGVNWYQNGRFKPVYSLGFAHASGEYRQSGLHSNDFRPHGKNQFRYLGEALDPELANLQILTIGVGMQLAKQWRADAALHSYRQVKLEDNIRGSDLEFDPDGQNKDIGTGLDVVLSYKPLKQLDLLGTAGVFEPGSAFADTQSTAWLARLEIEYEF